MKNKQVKQMIVSIYREKYKLPVIWVKGFRYPFIDDPDLDIIQGICLDTVSIKASEGKAIWNIQQNKF